MIKSLIFSIVKTHLDIAFIILVINCFAKNLSYQYTKVVKIIIHYLKVTHTLGITYERDIEDLIIREFFKSD